MDTSDLKDNQKLHASTFNKMVYRSKHESNFYKFMKDKNMKDITIMRDLSSYLHATPDTLGNTMQFGILLLCLSQNVTLVNKIGNYLLQSYTNSNVADFDQLLQYPPFKALIYEILRIATVTPLGLPHYCNQDVTVTLDSNNNKSYIIPEGCMVYPNLVYTQNFSNTESWNVGNTIENQYDVKLSNWLDTRGNFKENESFATFSKGVRNCMGKKLAIRSMSMIFGILLIKYEFEENRKNPIVINKKWGLSLEQDPPQSFCVRKRQL